ncbi:MAG: hypothetical protein R6U57_01200 [Anaerolineales bacterium]
MSSSNMSYTFDLNDHFPFRLDNYPKYGLYALVGGTLLVVAAFFTNSVPDPSFPWASLPSGMRLPFTQPRIEHWPVSYTIGIWLWVFAFPALFLEGYRRYGRSNRHGADMWLMALPVLAMLGWTTYCRFLWPKLYPPSWNAPAYTLVCWLYCATYNPLWSNAAYAISGMGILAVMLAWRRSRWVATTLTAFGILSFPLGIPTIFISRLRKRDTSA